MTFEEWWHEHGSGLPPNSGEDAHEHVHRVAALSWQAAQSVLSAPLSLEGDSDERRAFEASAPMNTKRRDDFRGVYEDAFMQASWCGWHARARGSPQQWMAAAAARAFGIPLRAGNEDGANGPACNIIRPWEAP